MSSRFRVRGAAVLAALAPVCALLSSAGPPDRAAALEAPNVAWVDDDGVQAKANHIAVYYKTIPDGLHAVGPGGTVYVLPGLYDNGGTISVEGGKSLIAMLDATHPVNPTNNPNITNWPVIIESDSGNGIESFGAQQNITIQGFYIRRAGANGIQIQGSVTETYDKNGVVTSVDINGVCEHMEISGNRVESTFLDGIKVTACDDVHIVGNLIRYTSGITATNGQMEQAIDFMMSANSVVLGNVVLDNAIGVVVKGGSVNMTVANNQFSGPFLWVAQSGEPVNGWLPYSSASSRQPWGVKDLVVVGNVLRGPRYDVAIDACQSCSYVGNTLGGGGYLIRADSLGVTSGLCIEGRAPVTNQSGGSVPVATSNCPTTFPPALIVPGGPRGFDMRPAN